MLRARAIENQAYVIGVNRCGRDPNVDYPGHSQIISPRGEVLGQFRPTGIRPRFSERLELYGFRLPPNIFEAAF